MEDGQNGQDGQDNWNDQDNQHGQDQLQLPSCVTCTRQRPPVICTLREGTPTQSMVQQSVSVREAMRSLRRLRMQWEGAPPRTYLIVHKEHDVAVLLPYLWRMVEWLLFESPECQCTRVWVHNTLDEALAEQSDLSAALTEGRLKLWTEKDASLASVDLVVALGGDGTVLTAAWLFQGVVPPIVPFHFGTVGFLNVFSADRCVEQLTKVVTEGCRVNIRMRLDCRLLGDHADVSEHQFQVMNEVVVDRGACPYMASLEIFADGHLITTVHADGLIVATPTGSTAYSMSAGGSVAHPDVPAILITPICPHTLSFRPLILPDSVELTIRISPDSRGVAWASFDGRGRVELGRGSAILIQSSNYPVPTVCRDDQTCDWFGSLARCLHWNDRPASRHL